MTNPTSRENSGRALSTADLAAASRRSQGDRRDPNEIDDAELEQSGTGREEREIEREDLSDPHRRAATSESEVHRAEEVDSHENDEMPSEKVGAGRPDTRYGGPTADLHAESLEPLFAADQAEGYRNRWIAIQSSFVDDPSAAVRAGDELVAQVMSELANSFADQRHRFESELDTSGPANTESLRVALRSYRSFFERLLSL